MGPLAVRFLLILFCIGTFFFAANGQASAETRSLKIYHVHTGEKAVITYKRNGRYIQAGLKKLDYILRDWRKDKEINMDPRMFDLLWEVYQKSGSRDYIHIICGYRTGDTNAMLRGRSRASGVAKKSQHILGKAIDFYIPDVPLERLREIGMKFQVGGVGYYPNSGSPFVHMDTGYVRAWPRMTRQQLVKLFPNGHTLHLPRDGKPLPGYEEALASYKHRVTSDSIMVAGGGSSSRGSGNLLAALFGGGGDEDEDLGADDTVQTDPQLHHIERKAMAPVHPLSPREATPVSLPKPANAPLPGVRPVAVAMATAEQVAPQAVEPAERPETTASVPDAAQNQASKYPDLMAYASIPIPQFAPDRGVKTLSAEDAQAAAAALVAKADIPAPSGRDEASRPDENLPVPGIRPELTAYAPIAETAPEVALASPSAPPVPSALPTQVSAASKAKPTPSAAPAKVSASPKTRPAPHAVTLKPSLIAAAARKGLSEGRIVVASLAPAPILRPAHEPSSQEPAKPFANVSDVRGGRLNAAGEGATRAKAVLTGTMIARWAEKNGVDRSEALKGARAVAHSGRIEQASYRGDARGRTVDPERFAAVSVYFPND